MEMYIKEKFWLSWQEIYNGEIHESEGVTYKRLVENYLPS